MIMQMLSNIVLILLILWPSVWSQGRNVGGPHPEEKCPLLQGVHVSVMRRVFNPGLHKRLHTEVEIMLTTTILPPKCRLLVEETIPRGAFVDPDELSNLRVKTGLQTYTPAKVDVEKPEFESEAFRVFIFRELIAKENLRVNSVELPVRMRYHRPAAPPTSYHMSDEIGEGMKGAGGLHQPPIPRTPFATVKIQNPRLLLSCFDDDITENCAGRKVIAYCDESGTSKCEWINLPYKTNVASIEVAVPVGNIEHASLVVGVTTIVTCGATIYLLIAMFRDVKHKHQ